LDNKKNSKIKNTEITDLSDINCKIIYRDSFYTAVKEYCKIYSDKIIANEKDHCGNPLRDNFIRKLDSLC